MGQSSFTPRHRKNTGRAFNGRQAIDRMYDHDWERYRARFLKENPECYACGRHAEVVDHITPHQGDRALFEKLDNHLPLCFTCHNFVTAKFDRHYRKGGSIEEKVKWLNQNRVPRDGYVPRRVKVLTSYR